MSNRKGKAGSKLCSFLVFISLNNDRKNERGSKGEDVERSRKMKERERRERKIDPGVDVGGVMTLPVRWPGRSITAGLSLRRN